MKASIAFLLWIIVLMMCTVFLLKLEIQEHRCQAPPMSSPHHEVMMEEPQSLDDLLFNYQKPGRPEGRPGGR